MHRAELAGFFKEAYVPRRQIIERAKHSDRCHPSSFVFRMRIAVVFAPSYP